MASLWNVANRSTAQCIGRFYTGPIYVEEASPLVDLGITKADEVPVPHLEVGACAGASR